MTTGERIISLGLQVENPYHILSNKTQNLLNYIREKYAGKCYFNTYIMDVLDIVETSNFTVDKFGVECGVSINVRVRVSTFQYNTNDVIVAGKIFNTQAKAGIILAQHTFASIYVMNGPLKDYNTSFIRVGSSCPIVVGLTAYNTGMDKISISGTIYAPKTNYSIMAVRGQIGAETCAQLEPILAEAERIEGEIAAMPADVVAFFRSVMYPWRDSAAQMAALSTSGAKVAKIRDVIKSGPIDGYFARHSACDMASAAIVIFPESAILELRSITANSAKIADVTMRTTQVKEFCDSLAGNYLRNVTILRNFCADCADDMANPIWEAIKSLRK